MFLVQGRKANSASIFSRSCCAYPMLSMIMTSNGCLSLSKADGIGMNGESADWAVSLLACNTEQIARHAVKDMIY